MPKIKPPVRTPHIDMTPMVDLFSVLLIFLLLTASFRSPEAAPIETPNSISEKQAPDNDLMTIFVGKDGKVFFNIDNGKDTSTHFRSVLLDSICSKYQVKVSKFELDKFGNMSSFGMPIKNIPLWIRETDSKSREKYQEGIPTDSADNQLAWWVRYARRINPGAEVAIKADAETPYMTVKKVMDLLQENKVNKFNLVTNLMKDEATLKDVPQE